MMDFENFVASIVQEKFKEFDEAAAAAREQQGIAQVGLGTRPMSDRPGLAKEDDEIKKTSDDLLKLAHTTEAKMKELNVE